MKYARHVIALVAISILCGCGSTRYSYPDTEVSIENLKHTVRCLSTIQPPRNYLHPQSLNRTADYISTRLKLYGLEPREQKYQVRGTTYKNIVASVGPTEGKRLVVGAHYDVCGNHPGADDNASGIAGLLEIARFAKKHESQLPYGVDFVAFTLEEPPFFRTKAMGSYVHAESINRKRIKLRGMICLDMIGFFSDRPKSQKYPLSLMRLCYPDRGDFIAIVSDYGSGLLSGEVAKHIGFASIAVERLKAPSFLVGVDFSDHRNYWKFGYDAVMVTDTSFFRNPNYHGGSDTMATLDFYRMGEVVKGLCWAVLNMR